MSNRPVVVTAGFAPVVALLGAACAQPAPPQKPPVEATKVAAPVVAQQAVLRIDRPPPAIKRDPYASYLDRDDTTPELGLTRLERIELDKLRVVGTALSAAPLALLEDSSGEGHVVHIGTALGTQGGRVTEIRGDVVIVEERFRDHSQRMLKVHKELSLAPARG
jgi:type IV pilus assembly protein PilP